MATRDANDPLVLVAKAGKRAALPAGRRRLYTAIMLALPVLLLLLLELALRLAGYGNSYPLFVAAPSQPEYLYPNQDVAKRYFRAGTLAPLPHLDFFRAQKQPGTFRIVFQGESSAAGFPYRHGGAPSRMLAQRLQASFPDRDIEVINTALTGINSYTLLDFADEIIAQHPDAVLIYTGHNEYYGVFGAGSARSVGGRRPLIKAYLALSRLRTVQLLNNTVAAVGGALRGPQGGEAPRTAMELLAGEQKIPLGSPLYRQGLEQFRANLRELLSRYQAHGVPVFIGTVASNERDQQPLLSGLAPATDTAADAFYALGRLHDSRGDYTRARSHYRAAKERDQLRFRAPEAINGIIRQEAARHGATVVETQEALARASPGGIIGKTLMLEHLHPNLRGYFLIADAFLEALRHKGMIGSWGTLVPAQQAWQEIPVTRVDSLVGVFRTDRLLSGWPFQPRGKAVTPVVDTLRPGTPEEQLAQGIVRGTLPWPEAMDRLRSHYERTGDQVQAMRAARALAQEYRAEPEPLMDAGRIALTLGRHEEALRYVRAANERGETASLQQLIGLLLLRKGNDSAAVRHLRRATQLAPDNQRMALTLMAAEAIPQLERNGARTPRDASALFNLGAAYAATQQYERAKETLTALHRLDPNHAGARDLLRKLPP